MAQAIRKTRSSVVRIHAAKKAHLSFFGWLKEIFGTLGAIVACSVMFIALVVMFAPQSASDSTAQAVEPEAKMVLRLDRAQHLAELEAKALGE